MCSQAQVSRRLRVHCAVLNARTGPQPGSTCSQCYGGHGERETPGNIPNPEAKPLSADGTAPGTGWESRTPPDNHSKRGSEPRALAPVLVCPAVLCATSRVRPTAMRYADVMTAPRGGTGGSPSRRGQARDSGSRDSGARGGGPRDSGARGGGPGGGGSRGGAGRPSGGFSRGAGGAGGQE